MVLFDLSHDRMTADPVTVVADVQAALVFDEERYADAARKIGLTPAEYDEFARDVMNGDVRRTTLPVRVDAMAGLHRGRVYALRNVRVRANEPAFAIVLADGKIVYVPRSCGNLSVVRAGRVQPPPRVAHVNRRPPPLVAAGHIAATPLAPPAIYAPAVAAPAVYAPAVVSAPVVAVPAIAIPAIAAHRAFPVVPFFTWLAGSITAVTQPNSPALPPCTASLTSDAHACSL